MKTNHSKGVNEKVSPELQLFCWQCIDEQATKAEFTMDYLQWCKH